MNQSNFSDFLHFTPSQKAVSLALATDDKEQQNFITTLQEQEFRQVKNISELVESTKVPSKVFYVITQELPQSIYEFIAQYPTGHLSIFDKTAGDFQAVKPHYTDVAVIFILTKSHLKELVQKGIALFDKVGIVYQT